jgi:hypothetical protein
MQKAASEAERLRREIGERGGKRGPLPREVRERGKEIARTRARSGATAKAISAELGMSVKTVERWIEPEGKPAMVPVRVVPQRTRAAESKSVVVTTASGLRIEGLDLDSLCALVARCG